jgi:hypothetical protein
MVGMGGKIFEIGVRNRSIGIAAGSCSRRGANFGTPTQTGAGTDKNGSLGFVNAVCRYRLERQFGASAISKSKKGREMLAAHGGARIFAT